MVMHNLPLLIPQLLLCWAFLANSADITDPIEINLLKIFHEKLVGDGPAVWNFNVDPCNSWSLPDQTILDGTSGVKCECKNGTCHITKLAVVGMNVAGQISSVIGNFTHLNDINLQHNMLTGTIPKEIGRLPLQYVALSENRLSGSLPSEIGNLTELVSFGFGENNLTGKLPAEMGKMSKLTGLYFNNNGFEGEIPANFSGLVSITNIAGYNNHLNGSIPDIFANMANLQTLRLYGNTFQGPIPSSLWNVSTLQKLLMGRSGISNLSLPSSLANMKALQTLSFRDCGLTGTIPNQVGDLESLIYLDLSFNNLTGRIPSTFGSLTSLNILFLGSNNLTGEVPSELNGLTKLEYIDLSYNQLSGSIPTWATRSSLHANLIWNHFDISTSTKQVFDGTSFNCLDSKSPCTRTTTGKNVKFAINCGGQFLSPYYGDTRSIKYADFSIHSSKHWAVSVVGFDDKYGNTTIASISSDVATDNAPQESRIDPSIYQTARKTPGSLRYFGLDMINGNYSLELYFAEIEISANTSEWQGNGQRLFDIYIQGERIYENFDIVDRAKGALKAYMVKCTAQVTQGVLEIHLKWSEMGTCCTPKSRTYGPLISAIVVEPDVDYSKSHGKVIGICIAIIVGAVLFISLIIFLYWNRQQRMLITRKAEEDLKNIKIKPTLFTYTELKVATKGFHRQNKLGEGGFGTVYKGVLSDGSIVAIKKLLSQNGDKTITLSNKQEFLNEVSVVSSIKHRNLVKLLGCCIEEDHRILVFEFLENNSLQHALIGPSKFKLEIPWSTRYNICIEIAKGIAYLHEESNPRVIHRDIKASNILLDKELHPKIADFGISKLFGDEQTHISTKVAGTIGYLSPEYAMRGQLTEKLDVYSFGVLALEIISGRSNIDFSLSEDKHYLLEWVAKLKKENSLLQVVDLVLSNQYPIEEATVIIEAAILCLQESPNKRPTMSSVVNMLSKSSKII